MSGGPSHLWKLVWPFGLSPLYELPQRTELLTARFLAPALLAVALTVALVALWRRWPGLLVAWLYGALMVLPVSGLVVHAGPQLVADRYSYLAGLGWAVLAGGALWRWGMLSTARPDLVRAAVVTALVVALTAVLGALTWQQVQIWRNTETLWTHATRTERSSVAHLNLGVELARQRRHAEAADQFHRAFAIRPGLAKAHNGLGASLAQQGRPAEAAAHFKEALRLEPSLWSTPGLDQSQTPWGKTRVKRAN